MGTGLLQFYPRSLNSMGKREEAIEDRELSELAKRSEPLIFMIGTISLWAIWPNPKLVNRLLQNVKQRTGFTIQIQNITF